MDRCVFELVVRPYILVVITELTGSNLARALCSKWGLTQ
jgi:hypothetical protein